MRVTTSDGSTNISFDRGALSHDERVLLVHPQSSGPNWVAIATITTSDMVLREDNWLKFTSDNIFGPELNEIKAHPTNNGIFYGVGYQQDYIGSIFTGLVVEFQLHDTYLISVIRVVKLNSGFTLSGTSKGWVSLDFDSTSDHLILSGIFANSSQVYSSIVSINKELTTFNWMKYFEKTSASSLNIEMDQIDSHYHQASNSVLVILHTKNDDPFNSFNIINVFKFNMTDGTLQWSIQFRDYAGGSFGDVHSIVNPSYDELVLFYTNNQYDYYHTQSISISDGSMLTNMQIEVLYHYALEGIAVFPSQISGLDSDDVLLTAVDGYIMKINTRKANLGIVDSTNQTRPLIDIHYDNYSLPLTVPLDVEVLDYSPASDFFQEETGYEMIDFGYTYNHEDNPTLSDATEMVINFENTNEVVNSPNDASFILSQPTVSDSLSNETVTMTLELFNSE